MANHALVNNVAHKDLKVITKRSAELGDNVWYSLTFPMEFRSTQANYPIFFNKDPNTGKFVSVALFGFQENENLFLDHTGWDAHYIPVSMTRQPFLIANQTITENGIEQQQRMLSIDMDSPRVSSSEGEPLFLEFGGNSEFLDKTASMLEALHIGINEGQEFADLLATLDLIEPFTLDVKLNNGEHHQMIGFYTINEDKLDALPIEDIKTLKDKGFLQAIYMMIASQSNIRILLDKKNALASKAA